MESLNYWQKCQNCGISFSRGQIIEYCDTCQTIPDHLYATKVSQCRQCGEQYAGHPNSRYCKNCKPCSTRPALPIDLKQGVYRIKNLINGKCYIGQSRNIDSRWKAHIQSLKSGKHKKSLQADYDQHGPKAFVFEILDLLNSPTDVELDYREVFWARHHQSFLPGVGYNDADPSLMKSKKVTVELSVEDLYILHRLFQTPGDKAEFLSQVVSTALKSLAQS